MPQVTQVTTRLATSSDLDSLIHLKAEIDYALKGITWCEEYHQSLQNYFAALWAQGQIVIAETPNISNAPILNEQTTGQNFTCDFELPPNLPSYITQSQPLILGAATVQYVPSGHEAHLYLSKLYVRPAFRRQGIATQILKFAASATLDFNCHALSLDTNPTLHDALHLYLAHGFIIETPPAQLHLAPSELYLVRRNTKQEI